MLRDNFDASLASFLLSTVTSLSYALGPSHHSLMGTPSARTVVKKSRSLQC